MESNKKTMIDIVSVEAKCGAAFVYVRFSIFRFKLLFCVWNQWSRKFCVKLVVDASKASSISNQYFAEETK